jgi:hypothetical protein
VSAVCTTPARKNTGGGNRTLNGTCPRRPQRRAFAITPPQLTETLAPGEGLEPSSPVPKTGVLPLDDPGMSKRTRQDSNLRPQAPQACALILLSYGFKRKDEGGRRKDEVKAVCLPFILHPFEAEAVRLERTGARTPGGLAGRCTTVYASPPKSSTEGVGVEPTGASKLRQFSGLLGVPGAQPSSFGRGARTRTGIGGFGVRQFGL